jgi:hypothetical protein
LQSLAVGFILLSNTKPTKERENKMRKIAEFKNETRKTTVKYNSEFREYQVSLLENGAIVKDATYYTDEKADAIATAEMMIKPNDVQANEMKKYNGNEMLLEKSGMLANGSAPTCPSCHHRNAMLYDTVYCYTPRTDVFKCRDCGFLVTVKYVGVDYGKPETIEELPANCYTADSPTCPACGHWNAMLFDRYFFNDNDVPDGTVVLKCRDCGHKAKHTNKSKWIA